MDTFNLKEFLTENRLTTNSKQLGEIVVGSVDKLALLDYYDIDIVKILGRGMKTDVEFQPIYFMEYEDAPEDANAEDFQSVFTLPYTVDVSLNLLERQGLIHPQQNIAQPTSKKDRYSSATSWYIKDPLEFKAFMEERSNKI